MVLGDEQIAARQAALNKALSTAYLNHQISELESQVQAVGLYSPGRAAAGHSIHADASPEQHPRFRRHDHHSYPDRHHGHHHHHELHQLSGPGRIDDSDRDHGSETSESSHGSSRRARPMEKEPAWRLAVVDVSALMWAPKTVRNLVSRGWEVVVPIDAIRTLDILKKGNSPSAIAARAATRYIEHAGRLFQVFGESVGHGRGLRIQRDEEAQSLSTLGDLVDIDGIPKWLTSVLSCAAYFTTLNESEAVETEREQGAVDDETRSMSDRDANFDGDEEEGPRPALYIAHPPISAEVGPPVVDERPAEVRRDADLASINPNITYAERGEGYRISQEAERFELFLEVLRDDEDDEDGMLGGGRGGRGRNRRRNGGREERWEGRGERGGRGGRGSGRGKGRGERGKKEKEPEVKILLRRPDASPASATRSIDPEIPGQPSLAPPPPYQPQLLSKANRFKPLAKPPTRGEVEVEEFDEEKGERKVGEVYEEYGGRGRGGRGGGRGRGGRGRGGGRPGSRESDSESSASGKRRGGRHRRRRGGDDKERKSKDKGGGFTLLQRPGPPLAHHVHAISPDMLSPRLPPVDSHSHPHPPPAGGLSPHTQPFSPMHRGPRPPPFAPQLLARPRPGLGMPPPPPPPEFDPHVLEHGFGHAHRMPPPPPPPFEFDPFANSDHPPPPHWPGHGFPGPPGHSWHERGGGPGSGRGRGGKMVLLQRPK